jgi:hypothetical protein
MKTKIGCGVARSPANVDPLDLGPQRPGDSQSSEAKNKQLKDRGDSKMQARRFS